MPALSGPGIQEYKGKEESGEGVSGGKGEEWEGWGAALPPPTLTQALLACSPRLTAQLLPHVCCPGILMMSQESGSGP